MRILIKNKQDELLKRIASCQIICNEYVNDIEAATYLTEHLATLAIEIGGCLGADKVLNTIHKYNKGGLNE